MAHRAADEVPDMVCSIFITDLPSRVLSAALPAASLSQNSALWMCGHREKRAFWHHLAQFSGKLNAHSHALPTPPPPPMRGQQQRRSPGL